MAYEVTHPIGTNPFVQQCEDVARSLVRDGMRIRYILYFMNHLKAGLYDSKEMAQAGLAYCAGRKSQVRATFYPVFSNVLENYTLEEAWVVLETILSYHNFYGGEK